MILNDKQLDLLNRRKIVVLATSKDNQPRAIFVEINKAENDEIVITNNEMKATQENILANKKVFILAFEEDYHYGLKISGEAEYHTEGKYFDFVKNLETNKKYSPKGAIVVKTKEVTEF